MKTSSLLHAGLMLALSVGAQATWAATTAPNYTYTDLKVNLFTPSNSDVMAYGLNASGQVAGGISKSTKVYDSGSKRWLAVTSQTPVVWSNKGAPSVLGMPKAVNGTPATATAWAINTPGTAVGEANGSPSSWNTAGALSMLDTRPGVAKVINDSGVVGGRVSQADIRDGILFNMDDRRATLWHNGVAQDLQQLLPRGNGAEGSEVGALNNAGTVGINGLPYLSNRLGACWLFKDGLITSLQNAQGEGCKILAIADDDTVVLRNARYPAPGTRNLQPGTIHLHHANLHRHAVASRTNHVAARAA